MSRNTSYSYKDSEDLVIENGIIRGNWALSGPEHNNYGEIILERFRANPQFVGQIDGITGRKENFAEMMEKSVKCAMWLKKENIQPGDVIGICTHNQMDMYVPILASLYVGAVFNPWWDNGLTKEIIKHFITLTRPKIVFIHEVSLTLTLEVIREMKVEIKLVIFGNKPNHESLENIIRSQKVNSVPIFRCEKLPSLDEPAFIVYTSGTTGLPKGILTSHRSVFGNSPNFLKLVESIKSVRSLSFASMSWGVGIAGLLRGFCIPETRLIYPEFREEKTLELIEKFKINSMHLSPRTAFKLYKSPSMNCHDVSSLKLFWISGGVMKEEMQNSIAKSFPQTKIYQAYGSSELGGVAMKQKSGYKPGSCGTIVDNLMMKIIDPATKIILGPNELGEVCFKSPFMMDGYLNNPEATRKAIDSEGWLHSGDLAHYDVEGHVFVTDRISEMINHRGCRISPEAIEQTMQSHSEILDVAVVAIQNNEDSEHPIAFVTKARGAKVTEDELVKLMADVQLEKIELEVKFMDELPHLPSGKIARADLKKLAMSWMRFKP